MNKLLCPLLVLALSSVAFGQERRYVHFEFSPDFESRLKNQVRTAAELEQMIDFLKKVAPNLLEKNGIDLKNLQLKPDGSGLSSLDPNLAKKLEKLKSDLEGKVGSPEQLKGVDKIVEKLNPSQWNQKQNPAGPRLKADGTPPREKLPAPPPAKDRELSRAARDLMRDVDRSRLGDFLRESRAWQRGLEELQRGTTFEGKGLDLSLLERITGRLKWPENLSLSDGLLERIRNINAPSLPRVNVNLPRIGGFNPLPSVRLPGVPSSGAIAWQGLLVAGLVLAAGALAWQLLSRTSKNSVAIKGWRIGPWPVAPGRVSSPAEFIKAFDYLAFLRLGLVARSWNHRRIAERLETETQGESASAARRLMRLYEEARYAPLAEWSHAVLAGARRDLCLVAGVPA